MKLAKPTTNNLLRRLRKAAAKALMPSPSSVQELIDDLHTALGYELIQREEFDIVERVLQVSELKVRDVMVPRALMVTIDHESTLDDILECGKTKCGAFCWPRTFCITTTKIQTRNSACLIQCETPCSSPKACGFIRC